MVMLQPVLSHELQVSAGNSGEGAHRMFAELKRTIIGDIFRCVTWT